MKFWFRRTWEWRYLKVRKVERVRGAQIQQKKLEQGLGRNQAKIDGNCGNTFYSGPYIRKAAKDTLIFDR